MALQNIPANDTLILALLLAVFLVIGYKVLDVLKNALIIGALSAIFPFVLNRYFGTSFATSLNSELTYVVAGVGMYFVYEIMVIALRAGGIVWELAKLAATPIVWIYDGLRDIIKGIFDLFKSGAPERAAKEKAAPEKSPEQEAKETRRKNNSAYS